MKDEKIDDSFPLFLPLTHIRTTVPNEDTNIQAQIPYKEWYYNRRWGIRGMVVDPLPHNTTWFEILHYKDGTVGWYHYTELELWSDGGGNNDDDDGNEEISPLPSGPIYELQIV